MSHQESNPWFLRTPEGKIYGPVAKPQLDEWVREGRVTADCQVRRGQDAVENWRAADSVYPVLTEPSVGSVTPRVHPATKLVRGGGADAAATTTFLRPHRGALILVLALVGLVVQCPVFSAMAWIMGSTDLDDMRAGRMDPSGEPSTRAGRLLGMILVGFWSIMLCVGIAVGLLTVALGG